MGIAFDDVLMFLFSISAAQSQTTLESLQCHFTWDLDYSKPQLYRLRDRLEDVCTDRGNRWLGHFYNLQGFIQFKLEKYEDAKRLFNKAAEVFSELRHADEGPWLVVNYGNLAWLHHHLGEDEESQAYLSKVDALMKKYPPPSQSELHPEIHAEKAWTLIYMTEEFNAAVDHFEKAARMQPDMVDWNSSYVIHLVKAQEHNTGEVEADLLEKIRAAKERDPENLYLAVLYLEQRAKKGEKVQEEVREFARNNLGSLSCSYSCMRLLLEVYKNHLSIDEAIDLAEEALKMHPDRRHLKKNAALCYRWKMLFFRDSPTRPGMKDRAISLHEELLSLYPDSQLLKKIDLATVYAKSGYKAEAEQIYQELLQDELDPADKQLLYNTYARYLYYDQHDRDGSIRYHMKAAEIPVRSCFGKGSMRVLNKIKDRGQHRMCPEIEEFLKNLQVLE
ncbi:interferon-induced protein with tetratricopeptide repeats 1B-like [Xyrichtys novacula]|uniref:Interferon-induced protein with tetratricopeptide repeats 1B-like n=1 Tax=Xyrichtys novacula TaxID=13765 RepID=A0AAV1FE91_XYRNO|nr:interferon-induced protein with tetratricopeptide repeats 1B-like [Xyrichtys novacula]